MLGSNLELVRGHNGALVLDLIRRETGISRVELARRTGLTPQSISKIVTRLIQAGVAEEVVRAPAGVGKPGMSLSVVGRSRFAIGMHVDRSRWLALVADICGDIDAVEEGTFDGRPSPEDALVALSEGAAKLMAGLGVARSRVVGAGLGMAGPLDHATGVLRAPTNFAGWRDVPFGAMLQERLGLPVSVDTDANAAAVAECWRAPHASSAAVVYIGSGIGAGLVLDGKVFRGAHSEAGEFGHMVLAQRGPLCACGRRGCVEALASPAGIVAAYERSVSRDPSERNRPVQWTATTEARLRAVERRAGTGDGAAKASLSRSGEHLGIGIGNLVTLLDVEEIVLTGPMVRLAGPIYADAVRRGVARSRPPSSRQVPVSVSGMDLRVTALGGALTALNLYGEDGSVRLRDL